MQQTCKNDWCKKPFEVTEEDLALLQKLSPAVGDKTFQLPPPELCFECRLRKRLAFYNCRSLYKNTCKLTSKSVVSNFSPDKPHTVYDKDVWHSDAWDPMSYGIDFDFARPFFEQIGAFYRAVPQPSLSQIGTNENSDFTNDNYKLKNCYLVFDGEQGDECLHGHSFVMVRSCMDFVFLKRSELCYECVHCSDCYNLRFSRYCSNCSNSYFLRDCIGCKDCFGCTNLRQQQYKIFNEQKTREEYEAFIASLKSGSAAEIARLKAEADAFFLTQPVKALRGEMNIETLGDNLQQCKGSYCCFDSFEQQDCRYNTGCMMPANNSMDIHIWGDGLELAYNSAVVGANCSSLIGDYYVSQGCNNVLYSIWCQNNCTDCFGCIGLKHKKYCVFNTQYTKQEYEELVPKIIEHMKQHGEWGDFFPSSISAFGYNETMAQSFFPLSKEEATAQGFQWSDFEAEVTASKTIDASSLPDSVSDAPDDVIDWAIRCEKTGKLFRIVSKELEFCRAWNLPLPRRHPDQRHADRYAYKNSYVLFQRECMNCKNSVQTTYAPDRPEIIYCDTCYLAAVS